MAAHWLLELSELSQQEVLELTELRQQEVFPTRMVTLYCSMYDSSDTDLAALKLEEVLHLLADLRRPYLELVVHLVMQGGSQFRQF